jgi:hypothetical protein
MNNHFRCEESMHVRPLKTRQGYQLILELIVHSINVFIPYTAGENGDEMFGSEHPAATFCRTNRHRHPSRMVLHGKQVMVISDDKQAGSDPGIEPAMCVTEAGQGLFRCS